MAANLALRPGSAGGRGRGRFRVTARLLAAVGPDARARRYPASCPAGSSRGPGLAVALANDPAVMLADEPTGELDRPTEADVLRCWSARRRGGVAVVVVSHSPAVAAAADRVVAPARRAGGGVTAGRAGVDRGGRRGAGRTVLVECAP